ncbi:hypothetical protein CTEN210_00390 [Chaetoceros tenuissimus]|uniref:RING-type domain-containing protein n=1 Tax=Chaetoceros tenuissimus TaxID=426638 RepID=A0AAD3CDR7_9STRA|nr:hypothetical protein CTEN210_00390 [Chaetoceros tenuissimus]
MSSRPERIRGSIGERIRVILVDDGDEWLLILNKDNGERKWQSQSWKDIPSAVSKQINNCIKKDRKVTNVDFNSEGAWYIEAEKYDGTGAHHWWGGTNAPIEDWVENKDSIQIYLGTDEDYYYGGKEETNVLIERGHGFEYSKNLPRQLKDCLKDCNKRRGIINFIRLFDENKYFISHDRGTEWDLGNRHIDDTLQESTENVHDIALANDGSWIIINDDGFESSNGIDKSLIKAIENFYSDQRRWMRERKAEIRDYDKEQSRLAEEARERSQREARLQREREELERRQRAEIEARLQREMDELQRREREVREAAEARRRAIEAEIARQARRRAIEAEILARQAAIEREKLKQQSIFQKALINRVTEEANDIAEAERNIEKRKQSLKQTLEIIPESARPKISVEHGNSSKNVCVVCQDENAVMAIVPCGHMCLCAECSSSIMTNDKKCPLCRIAIREIMKIYFGNN